MCFCFDERIFFYSQNSYGIVLGFLFGNGRFNVLLHPHLQGRMYVYMYVCMTLFIVDKIPRKNNGYKGNQSRDNPI